MQANARRVETAPAAAKSRQNAIQRLLKSGDSAAPSAEIDGSRGKRVPNGRGYVPTIDLAKDFVPHEGPSDAMSRRTVLNTVLQHKSALVPFIQPPAAVASSVTSLSEVGFLSPEAALAASRSHYEYIRHASALPPLSHRPFSVPESSPR